MNAAAKVEEERECADAAERKDEEGGGGGERSEREGGGVREDTPRNMEKLIGGNQSRKLKSSYGTRNRFQEPSLELSSRAT